MFAPSESAGLADWLSYLESLHPKTIALGLDRVQVVREAVGDRDAVAHVRGLLEMDAKYADVISLEAAVTYLAGLPGGTA